MQTVETQTTTVREAIEDRRSIRKYLQEEPNMAQIEEILRLTSLAPSAWNVQPWRFHLVVDPAVRERFREAAYDQPQVTSAPVVVVVASDMEDVMENIREIAHPGMSDEAKDRLVRTIQNTFGTKSVQERGQWGLTQANIALGYLLIAARGMGYATVPMLGFDQGKVRQVLGLPDHLLFAAMVPIGRPAEEGYPHHRHTLDRIITYH